MDAAPTPEPSEDVALRELMRRYQEGRVEAFEELYRRTFPLVRGYVLAMSRDRAAAEDLAQETFLQVHRSRHTYDSTLPLRPWLLGIARHVRLRGSRVLFRRRAHEVDAGPVLPEVPIPAEMEAFADRDAVRGALAGLPDDRREAVLLHHVYGLSFREIGLLAGASEVAVRIRASRGMARLRELLGGGCS
jgi:RNA polymerase sigma-70 factor (ECF subfamily)